LTSLHDEAAMTAKIGTKRGDARCWILDAGYWLCGCGIWV